MAEASEYRAAWQQELALRTRGDERIAELEDELKVAREDIQTAYDSVKPPVNIDTSTKIDGGAGGVKLPDGTGPGLVVLGGVALLIGVVWWFFIRKKKH